MNRPVSHLSQYRRPKSPRATDTLAPISMWDARFSMVEGCWYCSPHHATPRDGSEPPKCRECQEDDLPFSLSGLPRSAGAFSERFGMPLACLFPPSPRSGPGVSRSTLRQEQRADQWARTWPREAAPLPTEEQPMPDHLFRVSPGTYQEPPHGLPTIAGDSAARVIRRRA